VGVFVVVVGIVAYFATGGEGALVAVVAGIALLALVRHRGRASAANRK
jgi:hypothetical protein